MDVPFNGNFYVNLSVIQRVPLGKYSIRRANQIAITPRFESRRIEIALPVSYYELFRPRVGLSFRYNIFTIGTDMISPLMGITIYVLIVFWNLMAKFQKLRRKQS